MDVKWRQPLPSLRPAQVLEEGSETKALDRGTGMVVLSIWRTNDLRRVLAAKLDR